MSDTKPRITFQLITEFMDAVNAKTVCPFCGGTSWTIEYVPAEGQSTVVDWIAALPISSIPEGSESNTSALTSRGIAAIPFVCNTCGFMRPHSFRIFNKWLQSRAEATVKESAKHEQ